MFFLYVVRAPGRKNKKTLVKGGREESKIDFIFTTGPQGRKKHSQACCQILMKKVTINFIPNSKKVISKVLVVAHMEKSPESLGFGKLKVFS